MSREALFRSLWLATIPAVAGIVATVLFFLPHNKFQLFIIFILGFPSSALIGFITKSVTISHKYKFLLIVVLPAILNTLLWILVLATRVNERLKRSYLITIQLLVLVLPVWAILTAIQLGYDFFAISGVTTSGFTAYLAVACWIIWGDTNTDPFLSRVRQAITSVLTNSILVTILAISLLTTCFVLQNILSHFDLDELERKQLGVYSQSLSLLGNYLSEDYHEISDSLSPMIVPEKDSQTTYRNKIRIEEDFKLFIREVPNYDLFIWRIKNLGNMLKSFSPSKSFAELHRFSETPFLLDNPTDININEKCHRENKACKVWNDLNQNMPKGIEIAFENLPQSETAKILLKQIIETSGKFCDLSKDFPGSLPTVLPQIFDYIEYDVIAEMQENKIKEQINFKTFLTQLSLAKKKVGEKQSYYAADLASLCSVAPITAKLLSGMEKNISYVETINNFERTILGLRKNK